MLGIGRFWLEQEKNQCQCQQTHKRSENQSSIEQKSTQWWVDGSSHFLHRFRQRETVVVVTRTYKRWLWWWHRSLASGAADNCSIELHRCDYSKPKNSFIGMCMTSCNIAWVTLWKELRSISQFYYVYKVLRYKDVLSYRWITTSLLSCTWFSTPSSSPVLCMDVRVILYTNYA